MIGKNGLYRIFVEESRELLAAFENDLLECEKDLHNAEIINRIFRSAHTLKGSAGMVDFPLLAEFTHEIENILARMRSGELKISKKLVSSLLSAADILKRLIEQPPGETPKALEEETRQAAEALRRYHGVETAAPETRPSKGAADKETQEERYVSIIMKFRPDIYASGVDPLLLLREVREAGEIIRVRCEIDAIPPLDRIQPDICYLAWELVLKTAKPLSAIEDIFIFVREDNTIVVEDVTGRFREGVDLGYAEKKLGEILAEEGIVAPQEIEEVFKDQKRAGEMLVEKKKIPSHVLDEVLRRQQRSKELTKTSTLRVDTGKLDKLVNLVGEMVIGVARMTQIVQSGPLSHNRDINDTLDRLERISHDVQEQVMRVRMIPIEATFRRFQRIVRDIAADLDKKISLYMSGTETELDKTVIEMIDDPLLHLVRNAADHGIEPPDERIKAGKPPEGSIWLRAYQQEGKIVVEVEDDGRGLDRERIVKKAVQTGIVPKGTDLTEHEAYNLLFAPGFSTADKVTELSGRGVGLDVVKRNVEKLRGNIEVYSEKGTGTLFRIKLPLTLAIIDGMRVAVGDEILTLPLLSIVEAIRPTPGSIKTIEGKGELVAFRGEYLPLIRLHEVLGFETAVTDPLEAVVVVIEGSSRYLALMVDDVIGHHQAVIKSLETNFRRIAGASGATILGDGRVSLILDVHGIEHLAFGRRRAPEEATA